MRRKKEGYFKQNPTDPKPLVFSLKRRVGFRQADVMGILWNGHYPAFFEEASAELCRECGLSYENYFEANLRAPIVQLHVDYHQPLLLDEEFEIKAFLHWNDGSRLNTEFALLKLDGSVAATGYTVQMFIDGTTGEPLVLSPTLWNECRENWKNGKFQCLQQS